MVAYLANVFRETTLPHLMQGMLIASEAESVCSVLLAHQSKLCGLAPSRGLRRSIRAAQSKHFCLRNSIFSAHQLMLIVMNFILESDSLKFVTSTQYLEEI